MNTLPEPYETIFAGAMATAAAIAFVVWFRILFFGWKAIANRREDVHLFRDAPLGNPGNILLRGQLLTEKGLAYRRKMLVSTLAFVGIVAARFAGAALIALVCRSCIPVVRRPTMRYS